MSVGGRRSPVSLSSYRRLSTSSRVLMVGSGGIGCELLKNLVLVGFRRIVVVDLDTIDVTNLNRQFLFQKHHVGQSKARVATNSVRSFVVDESELEIEAIHGSIIDKDFGISFYKQFDLVLNALDNRRARSHVNFMCLASNVPLVESGSAGYLGQVTSIHKGVSECYDCRPKARQKTFPGCTIRNTPSEPIHCIVWAKHLFNQLFGSSDPDEEVSPDSEDPGNDDEKGDNGDTENTKVQQQRVSTREWAKGVGYDAKSVFNKLFYEDINYLLTMDKLWAERRPPKPINASEITKMAIADGEQATSATNGGLKLKDQKVWTLSECWRVFQSSIDDLYNRVKEMSKNGDSENEVTLSWDKDDHASMDFVASCSNIRSYIFGMELKSRFDIKSMAGNIIPAIATTNAIVAGAIVMEALKILAGDIDSCRSVYLNVKPNPRGQILVPMKLDEPISDCYVCSNDKHAVILKTNLNHMSVKRLVEQVLKSELNMVAPDIEVEGFAKVLVSSEEGETPDDVWEKKLSDCELRDGSILHCDDFGTENYAVRLVLVHQELKNREEADNFELVRMEQEQRKRKIEPDNQDDNQQPESKKSKIVTEQHPQDVQAI